MPPPKVPHSALGGVQANGKGWRAEARTGTGENHPSVASGPVRASCEAALVDLSAMQAGASRADMHVIAARLRDQSPAPPEPSTTRKRMRAPGAIEGVTDAPVTAQAVLEPQTPRETESAIAIPETPQHSPATPHDLLHQLEAGLRVPRTPLPRSIWYRQTVLSQPKLGLCSRYALAAVASGISMAKYERVLQPTSFLHAWLAQRGRLCAQWPAQAAEAFGQFRMVPPQSNESLDLRLQVSVLPRLDDACRVVRHWQGFPRVVVVARLEPYHSCKRLHAMVATAALEDSVVCTNSWGVQQPLVEVGRITFDSAWLIDVHCENRETGINAGYDMTPAALLAPSSCWRRLAAVSGPWQ
jgi:hypothetical protein